MRKNIYFINEQCMVQIRLKWIELIALSHNIQDRWKEMWLFGVLGDEVKFQYST